MVNAWKEPVVWFVPCPLSNTISFSAPGKYIYIWNYDHATHIFTYNGMMTHLLSPNGMIVLTLTLISYISTVICTGGAVIVESDQFI